MVTFFLVNRSRNKSPISILVSFRGSNYRRGTGESCLVSRWNDKKRRVKITANYLIGSEINDILDKLGVAGIKSISHFKTHIQPPAKEIFFKVFDDYYYDNRDELTKVVYFLEYLENIYIPRYTQILSPNTLKAFKTAFNKIKEFEQFQKTKLTFEDINIDFYNNFKGWFYERGFTDNYFGIKIKIVKQVFREAKDVDKLHDCSGIDHRNFSVVQKTADNIFLTEEELQKMKNLDITYELIKDTGSHINQRVDSLIRARNTFLIGAYTGLRVSDYKQLSKASIDDKFIKIRTQKTEQDIVVPIHPVVKDILDSGFNINNCINDTKLNKDIKEVAMLAGINEFVKLNKNIGGKVIQEEKEKYKLITSHTARRSFVTNALIAGVSPQLLIKITGHTQEASFQKYIKMSGVLTAQMLSEHNFFKEGYSGNL